MLNIRKFLLALKIIPVSTTSVDSQGEIEVLSTTTKANYHNGTTASSVVTETHASQGAARLQNKDLDDGTTAIVDSADTTKKLLFNAAGTTGTTTTLLTSQTTSQVLTLPDATDTLTGKATTDILTNKTLSGNTATNLVNGAGTFNFNSTGTITSPNATDTLVGKATTDILTNKTLTGNTAVNLISGAGTFTFNTTGTITAPNATDTLVGKATTDTFTNKTFGDAITLTQIVTPSNPAAGFDKIYAKADDNLYILTSGGIETQVGGGGGGSTSVQTKTANYTTLATDDVILVDASSTPIIITLLAAVGLNGKRILIKKIDNTNNSVTIARTASNLIDGEISQVYEAPMTSVIWIADNVSNWYGF